MYERLQILLEIEQYMEVEVTGERLLTGFHVFNRAYHQGVESWGALVQRFNVLRESEYRQLGMHQEPLVSTRCCAWCKNLTGKLKACSRCKQVVYVFRRPYAMQTSLLMVFFSYCDHWCQAHDWRQHKVVCRVGGVDEAR